jgi:putative oxidoreductase
MSNLQNAILLMGRLLMALLFLPSGLLKAFAFQGFVSSLNNAGLPYPEVWAVAAIAIQVLAPLALLAGVFHRTSALTLIIFIIAATAIAHRFWEYPEAQQIAQRNNFLKNVAVIGGLLFYLVSGPGALAWGRGEGLQGQTRAEQPI